MTSPSDPAPDRRPETDLETGPETDLETGPETDLETGPETGPETQAIPAVDAPFAPPPAPEPPPEPEPDPDPDLIVARGLDHGSGHRRVFAGLDLDIPPGRLAVVLGGDGSGKSLLLLALIGRTGAVHGSIQVAGVDALAKPRRVRRIGTAARIADLVGVEPRHTITQAVRERSAIEGVRRAAAESGYRAAAQALGLDAAGDVLVEDLGRYDQALLELALACVRPSRVIVFDDVERGLDVEEQRRFYRAVDALVETTGSTIVVATGEPASVPPSSITIALPPAGGAHQAR